MRQAQFVLSDEVRGWAQLARYTWEPGDGILRRAGEPGYVFRVVQGGRVEMVELDDDGGHGERILYAATAAVMEHFALAVLGDDIRDDLGLAYLDLPGTPADIAPGYRLGEPSNGLRTLFRGPSPIAAAPGAVASVAVLVSLSQFLGHSLADLRRSFLDERGAPLLRAGRYA